MKRYGNLYPQITSFENLFLAAKKAQKSKRFRSNVLEFNHNLEAELFQLQAELRDQTYQPGAYKSFHIYEPKPRLISAAPYRDRVVHHALIQVINPLIEPCFIHHSYANRVGFGSHKALRRFAELCSSYRYVLQCDVRRYFPNIDHEILKAQLRRKLKDPQTLWLIDTLIDHSNTQESDLEYFPGDTLFTPYERRKGLPIGNLTSQFFANLYLNAFDHFIHQTLKISGYVRYMDDFALFSHHQIQLAQARPQMEAFLATLRLRIHPIKSQLFETRQGANFVGFRCLRTDAPFPKNLQIRVRNHNLRRHRRRRQAWQNSDLPTSQIQQSLQSWNAHLAHGHTWKLRRKVFATFPSHWLSC